MSSMKNRELIAYYQHLYTQYGDAPESVQYPDAAAQHVRFEILSQVASLPYSVLDLGCGLADFLKYMLSQKQFSGSYCGLDFVPEFIQANRAAFAGHDAVSFIEASLFEAELPQGYDYAFASGIFNNHTQDSESFFYTTLQKMFAAASKGIAFNALSTYVDYQDAALFYLNPTEVFDYIKRHLSRKVILKHDYLTKPNSIPYEFTIFVYK